MTTARETTKEKNARFGGLAPAQQRVAIARDALAWIRAGALVPQSNQYVDSENVVGCWRDTPEIEGKQLREANLGKCRVCAIGALFLAKAARFDAVTIRDYKTSRFHEKLAEHFSREQIGLIEIAFEGSDTGPYETPPERKTEAAKAFWRRYAGRGDSATLVAILRNIVRNDGTFRPEAS